MLFLDVIRISSRSFKNNRLRTVLTVTGISVGIGTIFFLVSLGYGFQKIILEKIANEESLLSLDVTQQNEAINLDKKSVEVLKGTEGVTAVYPLASQDAQINGNELKTYAKINIVNAKIFGLEGVTPKWGSLFKEGDVDKMVISSAALQLLAIKEEDYRNNKITVLIGEKNPSLNNQTVLEKNETPSKEDSKNKEVKYTEKTYDIAGVIDDSTKAYLYIPDISVSNITFDSYEKLKVKVVSTSKLEEIRGKIIEKGFFVSSVSETADQARQIFSIAQIVLVLFGVAALIVSAIGMFNTMTIALLERTQEIGIMKSIGASAYDVWRMFLAESMLIGFFGGVSGVLLGYVMSKILNFGINWLATMFGGSKVDIFSIQPWFVLFIIVFSTSVGLITGFYPARRAAKLNALEALRYK
ncbi:MAG: FtsX-like permease family protein [Candidatus Moraniibacteriota bacterium]